MKNIKLALLTLASALLMVSCQDGGYGSMDDVTTQSAFGNNDIQETNVWTIAQLRASDKYNSTLKGFREYKLVDDDIQLKVRVVGNDLGGNIYNKVALQDEEGNAIIACVYSGGMFSYLPVGQELLIDLKGLYVGTYGYLQLIGVPYTTSSGNTYPGRMDPKLWMQHIKLLGYNPQASNCQPKEVTVDQLKFSNKYPEHPELIGRLLTLKNVKLADADGKNTWAPEDKTNFSISRGFVGVSSSVIVYTSTSAKFAAEVMPTGTVDVTGVFALYNNTWQILLRTADDVKPSSAN